MYGSAIKRLVVENFFTWTRRQELKFPESGKVVVVGENGSGKSNLLRAVELLARWFPKLVTCEEESAWDGTKSAELTLEMVVPSNLREELIRGVALELLRMIQPDLWSQAGGVGRTRIAEIYSQIRSVLDVGGLFKCVTVSYLTRPEWQGHLRPFCQTRWEKKLVSLLSHGARTGFRILSDDWNHESVYNPNAQTDTDDYLAALIAKRVLKEHEKALWGKQGYNTWKLDQLAGVSGLAAEVSLYRKLLLKEQGDRWNREKAIENSFAVSLETQRARIERQYGALISVEQAKDLESAKIQARNGMGFQTERSRSKYRRSLAHRGHYCEIFEFDDCTFTRRPRFVGS
jgi:energy-coupling factor transporter ATP-binding protein EcfA2